MRRSSTLSAIARDLRRRPAPEAPALPGRVVRALDEGADVGGAVGVLADAALGALIRGATLPSRGTTSWQRLSTAVELVVERGDVDDAARLGSYVVRGLLEAQISRLRTERAAIAGRAAGRAE